MSENVAAAGTHAVPIHITAYEAAQWFQVPVELIRGTFTFTGTFSPPALSPGVTCRARPCPVCCACRSCHDFHDYTGRGCSEESCPIAIEKERRRRRYERRYARGRR